MNMQESAKQRLLRDLGMKPLNRTRAKVEILLGLAAMFAGLIFGFATCSRPFAEWNSPTVAAATILFMLGGYLAMAGHRSHQYQSQNELIAYLAEKIERLNVKG